MQATSIDRNERIGRGVFSRRLVESVKERRSPKWRRVRGLFSLAKRADDRVRRPARRRGLRCSNRISRHPGLEAVSTAERISRLACLQGVCLHQPRRYGSAFVHGRKSPPLRCRRQTGNQRRGRGLSERNPRGRALEGEVRRPSAIIRRRLGEILSYDN